MKNENGVTEKCTTSQQIYIQINLPGQGNVVNATYDVDNQPSFISGKLANKVYGMQAVIEMARME